jgi:hypothetical protein
MDLITLKGTADYAAKVIGKIARANKETREQWKTAVSRLQKAVLQTKLYVSALDRGEPMNRRTEHRLVALWGDAATEFYDLDGSLASRLQLKAEYWTQPEGWTSQQVRDAGIALDHVAEYTRQLLHERR